MSQSEKRVFRQQLPVFLSEIGLCAAMLGVYAAMGKLTSLVALGAIAGTAASLMNYAAMIFSLLKAEKSESPEKGQLQARGNYMLRMLLLIGVLVVAIKFGKLDPIATLLPLLLMRIALFIGGLLIKNEGKGEKKE